MVIKRLFKCHRITHLYDDCVDLDDVLKRLNEEIIHSEDMQDLDVKVDSSTDGSLDLSVEVPDGLPDKIKKLKNIDFTEEEDIESE